MADPAVDLIIAVHDPRRPIRRAVTSVIDGTRAHVRVSVVVHNTPADGILEALGPCADDERVRLIEVHDGIQSPAGPFNGGLDAATAAFTSVMGSDDTLEAGAIDSWLALARRESADVVMARLRHADGGPGGGAFVPTPPTRPFRTTSLDAVRDRLSYRSAPLGLVSTAAFGRLRFAGGRPVGEDVSYVTRMWFSNARIAYDRRGPAYLLHQDVEGRTTVTPRPIAEELQYLPDVLDADWFAGLRAAERSAFCVKAIRIHLFGAVANRPDQSLWTPSERLSLRDSAQAVIASGGGIERVLSRRDRALLDAILDVSVPAASLISAAEHRRSFAAPTALVPRRLRHLLHREAPLRMAAASALQLR